MSRVKPGPHAIALFPDARTTTAAASGILAMRANASAITSDLSLALPLVRDVRIQRSTARPIDIGRSSIGARVEDGDDVSKRELLLNAIDADAHALSGDRAGDEDNLSFVPREHAPAGDGLLDR